MAILKSKDIAKMNLEEITKKLKELKVELVKSKVAAQKSSKSNTREIKRTIAKLLTYTKIKSSEVKSKK